MGYVGAWATGATAGLILLRIGTEPGRLGGAALWGLALMALDMLADRVPFSRWASFAAVVLGSVVALPLLVAFAAGPVEAPPLRMPVVLVVALLVGVLQLGLRSLSDVITGPREA